MKRKVYSVFFYQPVDVVDLENGNVIKFSFFISNDLISSESKF